MTEGFLQRKRLRPAKERGLLPAGGWALCRPCSRASRAWEGRASTGPRLGAQGVQALGAGESSSVADLKRSVAARGSGCGPGAHVGPEEGLACPAAAYSPRTFPQRKKGRSCFFFKNKLKVNVLPAKSRKKVQGQNKVIKKMKVLSY